MKHYGFTLVELMAAVAFCALVIGGILGVLTAGRQSWDVGNTEVELQQQTRRAMDWMVGELRQSGQTTIVGVPADGNPYTPITFQKSQGWDSVNQTINWGNQIQYSHGGLDLDSDGDQDQLLRTEAGQSMVLANNIEALQFRRSALTPNTVEISLQVQKDAALGPTMQSTLNSQITLRN